MSTLSVFGEQLRAWRKRRGMSQLDLALAARTTPRHVSFVETGRSRPGEDLVLRIADALDLTLRDRNALLRAAGLQAAYTEHDLDADDMAPVRRVIEHVLRKHDPFPAWAFAPGLRIIGSNRAAERLMPGMATLSPEALVDLWCTGQPGVDPAQDVQQVIAVLRHELHAHPHPAIGPLLRRAEQHAEALGPAKSMVFEPVMCPTMMLAGREIRTIATVLRFDKAADVTMAEVRIELLFPADEESEAVLRESAGE